MVVWAERPSEVRVNLSDGPFACAAMPRRLLRWRASPHETALDSAGSQQRSRAPQLPCDAGQRCPARGDCHARPLRVHDTRRVADAPRRRAEIEALNAALQNSAASLNCRLAKPKSARLLDVGRARPGLAVVSANAACPQADTSTRLRLMRLSPAHPPRRRERHRRHRQNYQTALSGGLGADRQRCR